MEEESRDRKSQVRRLNGRLESSSGSTCYILRPHYGHIVLAKYGHITSEDQRDVF